MRELIEKAISARKNAYAPYSKFHVGAALLTDSGKIYSAANVENASYPVGICAERTVMSYAVANGERHFKALALVGGLTDTITAYCTPCGMCRQFMSEFCGEDFQIILVKNLSDYKILSLKDLLPYTFDSDSLI